MYAQLPSTLPKIPFHYYFLKNSTHCSWVLLSTIYGSLHTLYTRRNVNKAMEFHKVHRIVSVTTTFFMVNARINDIISDSLGDNVLSVLRTVKLELLCYVWQRDPGVGQVDHSHTCLNHIVAEPYYKRVCMIGSKPFSISAKCLCEFPKISYRIWASILYSI